MKLHYLNADEWLEIATEAYENGGKDVFVHITKLEEIGLRKLYEGQRVSYEIYDDRGRTAAGSLEIL